jgi:hypothetical protein
MEDFKKDLINYFDERFQPSSNIGSSKIIPVPKKQRRVNPKVYIQCFLKEYLKDPAPGDDDISSLMEILDQEAFSSILTFAQQSPEAACKIWRQLSSFNKLSMIQSILQQSIASDERLAIIDKCVRVWPSNFLCKKNGLIEANMTERKCECTFYNLHIESKGEKNEHPFAGFKWKALS